MHYKHFILAAASEKGNQPAAASRIHFADPDFRFFPPPQ
jgi:hypothetical protein